MGGGPIADKHAQKLLGKDCNEDTVNQCAEEYFTSYREGSPGPKELGYPDFMYGMSKILINCWVNFWAHTADVLARDIQVYSMCPGYVDTDMTNHKGNRTIHEGAKTPVYLIGLPYAMN